MRLLKPLLAYFRRISLHFLQTAHIHFSMQKALFFKKNSPFLIVLSSLLSGIKLILPYFSFASATFQVDFSSQSSPLPFTIPTPVIFRSKTLHFLHKCIIFNILDKFYRWFISAFQGGLNFSNFSFDLRRQLHFYSRPQLPCPFVPNFRFFAEIHPSRESHIPHSLPCPKISSL